MSRVWITLLICALAGCAGDKAAPAPSGAGAGWIISFKATEPRANFYALYELTRDNTLTYSAGKESRIAWRGRLTDDEARAIIDLVEADRDPVHADVPAQDQPGRHYTLRTTPPGAWVSTTLDSGPTPFLDGLYEMFLRTQMARRKDVLEPAVTEPVR